MSTTARIDPRFSSFLAGQRVDARGRRRWITSAVAAGVTVCVAGASGWTADKLGVAAVAAPKAHTMITIDLGPPPPPAAKPPPSPSAAAVAVAKGTVEHPRPRAAPPHGSHEDPGPPDVSGPPGPPGPPHVPPGPQPPWSGPRCLTPPCGAVIGDPPPPNPPGPVSRPVRVVKANAIFSPDPDQRRLSRTKSGLMRRPGAAKSAVSFCVAPNGKVVDVRTSTRYPGDPEVDRICREAVARWRFDPFIVDGTARKTCTTTTFSIEFE